MLKRELSMINIWRIKNKSNTIFKSFKTTKSDYKVPQIIDKA